MSKNRPDPIVDPLAHPICLASPRRRTAVRAWHEHIPFAMFLVDLLRPPVLVELGVHAGDSYGAFCQAVQELNLDTRCYGVDTWEGDAHSGFYGAAILDDLRAHHDPLYGTFSSLIQSTFDDAVGRFADGTIDLLHIDGYHTYDVVKHDFESWLPKLSAQGVVLLHDTNVRERDFGVGRFWGEVQHQYPSFEFVHGHGLGLLAVGDVRSPQLRAMLDAEPDEAVKIRSFFFQLGHRLSLRDDVDALHRRLEEAQTGLAAHARHEVSATDPPDDHERGQAPNMLQVFWDDGGGFSEGQSFTTPLIADGQIHHYMLRLPSTARGPLRLDPGDRRAYVEVYRIELGASRDDDGADGEMLCRWSGAEDDADLTSTRGLTRLSGQATYRFICTDDDPRLLLHGVPAHHDSRPWFVRATLRVSERVLDILADEIGDLERELERRRRRLLEREAALEVAHAQSAEHEKAARGLTAQLAEHEAAFRTSQEQWQTERERLVEQLAEQRRAVQSQSAELGRARDHIARLEAQTLEQEDASAAWQAARARLARQVEAQEHAISSLGSDLEQRRRELLKSHGQLEDREHLLYRITSSRGWRALNGYRQLKHRVLLPVYRMGELWNTLVRPGYRPDLQPISELRWLHDVGVWESTDRDPQFNLSGRWPEGWAEVTLDVEAESAVVGHARLYVDRGAGFSERESYDLGAVGGRRTRYVWLGPDVIAVRLDPFESAGRFRIPTLTLRRVPARRARNLGVAEAGSSGARQEGSVSPQTSQTIADAVAPDAFVVPRAVAPYEAWLEVNEWNARRAALLGERLSTMTEPLLLSVVMPVYDPAPAILDKAIASVAGQVYPHWELCIADDASTDPAVGETLRRWAEREPRVRVSFRDVNGHVSRATNTAAEAARGEFLALMDQDDEITPDALAEVALYLAEYPDTDVLYSDDDKIDAQGRRFAPQFKPDWSPELLLSYMYWSHLLVVRRRLFIEAGGLRVGYEGAQDYDFALRVAEVTDRVGHLPKMLYHWRALPGSTAVSGNAKPESFGAGLRAVQEALDRRGVGAVAHQPDWALRAGRGIFAHEFPAEGPRVAVIILTKHELAVVKTCLESLARTTYKNYEVVIVDNGSDDAETLEFLGQTPHRVLGIPNPGERFNVAAMNNRAVEETDAEYVLFLDDDTEVVAPEWLSQMVGYLGLPGVGAVGARLRLPDGRLHHAGIVHGYDHGLAGPAFKRLPGSGQGYLSFAMVARNYAAVTGACLLTRRELFVALGGFDAQSFAVAYHDVDYCYRLRAAGYRVVYCPTAELIHHEGASRGFADNPAEPAAFRRKYGGRRDPFYHQNLSLQHELFAVDARTVAPARMPPIRALMCAFNLNWEGAPYSQLELTVGLKDAGVIEPIVYCPQDGPLRAVYEAHGIRVEISEHPLRLVYDVSAYETAMTRFAQWIEALNVGVVYANTRPTFYAIEAAKRLGLPSVWNPRESEPWHTYFDYLGPEIASRALRCFGYPYKVVFVADATRESCAPLNAHHNFITIHTGLDRQRFAATLDRWPRAAARRELNVAPDEIVVLSLGTVCERKGQLDLVEAVARLDERSASTIRCFVVGDRPSQYSERVQEARYGLPTARQSRIEIVTETPDPGLYYAASDVFVLSSRVESYPRVILEAMAAGLPIITTPVYGIAEQVRENVNALCYAPGDVQALADHLERLCREPRLRHTLADNSRHVLDTLNDFESMVAAYADVFREAWLSGRPR